MVASAEYVTPVNVPAAVAIVMVVDALHRMCMTGVSHAPVPVIKPPAINEPVSCCTGIIIVRDVLLLSK